MAVEGFDDALLSRFVFDETNRTRVEFHLKPFAANPELDAAAAEQCSYMALVLRATHSNPIPGSQNVVERIEREGVIATRAGENAIMVAALRPPGSVPLEYGYAECAKLLVDAWMNSPDHRANILNSKFTELGCATRIAHSVAKGDQRIFSIQVFIRPKYHSEDGGLSR
jgi:uncharacterized protein YkwD